MAPGPAAIVVALSWEAAPIARHLGLRRHGVQRGVTQYRGGDERIHLLQVGMGPRGAARALGCLEEKQPALLLSAGFCGGVGTEVSLGDMLVASQVVRHTGSFPADPLLLKTASRVLKTIGLPFQMGSILTVDEVVAPGEGIREMGDLQIQAVDMESAYLAEGARRQGIPFLAMRVVSDTPTEPWAAQGKLFVKPDGRLKPVSLAASLLHHPSWIPRLFRVGSTLRRATRQLARGIEALLKELNA